MSWMFRACESPQSPSPSSLGCLWEGQKRPSLSLSKNNTRKWCQHTFIIWFNEWVVEMANFVSATRSTIIWQVNFLGASTVDPLDYFSCCEKPHPPWWHHFLGWVLDWTGRRDSWPQATLCSASWLRVHGAGHPEGSASAFSDKKDELQPFPTN